MPNLIGISGLIGSGKTLLADTLCAEHNYQKVKMATPIKDMLLSVGLTQDDIEGETKEIPNKLLCGKSPRFAMQTLGTEWGRNQIGDDVWVNLWGAKVETLMSMNSNVVCDDIRFPNEVEKIQQMGGIVVRLSRGVVQQQTHSTENQQLNYNILLDNNGDIQDVVSTLFKML